MSCRICYSCDFVEAAGLNSKQNLLTLECRALTESGSHTFCIRLFLMPFSPSIHVHSILGMNLFGCKFCEETKEGKFCDRKNFDSLLWATVTVFQVSGLQYTMKERLDINVNDCRS